MFRYLRNLFRKKTDPQPASVSGASSASASPATSAPAAPQRVSDSQKLVARVETAQLQLAAIVSRFPDDLRKLLLKQPAPEAMVALPIPAILKFLPTGSVKI